jgi:putative ABC transport system permease protein
MREGRNELIDGQLRLGYSTFDGEDRREHTFDVPAMGVDAELIDRGSSVALVGGLLTTDTAARYSLALDETLRIVDPSGPISAELENRLDAAIGDPNWGVRVERGYQGRTDPYVWLMTAFLALLAVIAAAMATILATAEQRPFLATFAAVGASPRLSRQVATAQAAILALLGTLIGLGIGMLAGVPMALATTNASQVVGPILVIPWQIALVFVVSIPAVAAMVAAVCVPERSSLGRRTG